VRIGASVLVEAHRARLEAGAAVLRLPLTTDVLRDLQLEEGWRRALVVAKDAVDLVACAAFARLVAVVAGLLPDADDFVEAHAASRVAPLLLAEEVRECLRAGDALLAIANFVVVLAGPAHLVACRTLVCKLAGGRSSGTVRREAIITSRFTSGITRQLHIVE
jgi:hypothetical protein